MHSLPRFAALAACVCLLLPLTSCKKKAPLPPPEFDSDTRALTGDAALENRITEAEDLERLTDEELAALKELGGQVGQSAALGKYIAALVGRGDVQGAIDALVERAWVDLGDEGKVADLLDLTMGQLRWSACGQITTSLVERRMDSVLFLLRGMCLRRAGDAANAVENIEAGLELDPLPREAADTIRRLVDQRAAGNQLPPAEESDFRVLKEALERKGPLHRLFVKHLTERADPGWTFGSLDWNGIAADEQRAVILSRSRSYRHCHELADYATKEPLSGKSTIVWMIDGLGRVTDAKVTESAWGGHEQEEWLNACLLDQVGRLRFPIPVYGRLMPARHRFSFSSDG